MKVTALLITYSLTLFFGSSIPLSAQPSKQLVQQRLHEAMDEYLKSVKPHHFCECNNCLHFYSGKLKVLRTGHVGKVVGYNKHEDRIAIWGLASAEQYSPFTSSDTNVNFYAEIKILGNDDVVVTFLKWKLNDCMKYVTLLDINPAESWEQEDEQEEEIVAENEF